MPSTAGGPGILDVEADELGGHEQATGAWRGHRNRLNQSRAAVLDRS